MNTTARSRAIAKQDEAIANNVATIQAAKRPTALDILANRLNITPGSLKGTLQATVFKNCNDSEFAALVIVANEYKLNPLTKEIYAFPQKGGGIVPLVSVDGWIRIMNEHPQFDGIEFEDIPDADGKLLAIEATIWRKDRSRAIKVVEYLSECQGTTGPWQKSPARMLRHRALIQCARIAFGFSGIYAEDDSEIEISLGGDLTPAPMRNVTQPSHQIEHVEAEPVTEGGYDRETGEVYEDETTEDATFEEDPQTGMTIDPREKLAEEIVDRCKSVELLADLKRLNDEWQPHIDMMDDDMAGACNRAISAARKRLTPANKG